MSDKAFKNEPTEKQRWAVALHGGAGTIERSAVGGREQQYLDALARALSIGKHILQEGGSSLHSVEQVVRALEDDPLFNAGRGAAITRKGEAELDAAIMDGRDRSSGAVAAASIVRNPVCLARRVMEDGEHALIVGAGADDYARRAGVELVQNEYFRTEHRLRQWQRMMGRGEIGTEAGEVEKGTVGAVALDVHGNLAAATSTGGVTNKLPGRVGDSSLVGIGTYADNETCAISCTGHGEEFIRSTVAFRVAALLEHRHVSLEEAAAAIIFKLLPPSSGGLIAIDRNGAMSLPFNTLGMNRGAADSDGRFEVAIW